MDCATQWRRETVFAMGMSKPVILTHGLDYVAVEAVIRLTGIKRKHRKRLFEKVRLIEIGAIEGFSMRTN